jgi:hypothetical protein
VDRDRVAIIDFIIPKRISSSVHAPRENAKSL